jgi:hypothetical protein
MPPKTATGNSGDAITLDGVRQWVAPLVLIASLASGGVAAWITMDARVARAEQRVDALLVSIERVDRRLDRIESLLVGLVCEQQPAKCRATVDSMSVHGR